MDISVETVYKILNVASNSFLDVSLEDGYKVVGRGVYASDTELWHFVKTSCDKPRAWVIRNKGTGLHLSISATGVGNNWRGTPLILSPEKFIWEVWPGETKNAWKIFAMNGPPEGAVVDIPSGLSANGTPVSLGQTSSASSQNWILQVAY